MSENQDRRAVYMGTFEAYKKSNAKHMTELIDIVGQIHKTSGKHYIILYSIALIGLCLSILGLVL